MDLGFKLRRVHRWASALGLFEALRFEIVWSFRQKHVRVRVPGFAEPFLLRRWKYDYESSDWQVFEQVFVQREFESYEPIEPSLIIDGGAYVGFSTAFYAKKFPNAKVIAIEPSHDNSELLRKNCRGFENVAVIEGGLWPVSGFLRIANPDAPEWAYRCEETEENSVGAIRAVSINEIMDQEGFQRCDLLKLDIEGAEELLFLDSKKWLPRVDAILVETHGANAEAAIHAACPADEWDRRMCGEKLLLTPSPNSLDRPSARAAGRIPTCSALVRHRTSIELMAT
jgi:FkbM family methyltransferase